MKNSARKLGVSLCLTALLLSLFAACAYADAEDPHFSKSDYNDVAAEAEDAVITLEGDHGTLSDTSRGKSGKTVVIERKGVYRITGSADGVTIRILEPKRSGNIYLILDNVSMTNPSGPCIEAQAAEKTILQCVGENSLSSTAEKGAVIASEDALTINGSGSLTIEGGKNAVNCKDVLRVTGASLRIRAGNDGLKGKRGVYIDGGSIFVERSYEAVEGGEVLISGGELRLYASDDGINAAGEDGLQGDVVISGGSLYLNAAGDAIDSNRSILFTGGTTLVEGPANSRNSIFDKGDTADSQLSISGGTVLAIGSAEKAKNFTGGGQYSRLEPLSGHAGDVITTDDGSGVSLTATKDFACVIYSAPHFTEKSSIEIYSAAQGEKKPESPDIPSQAENVYMQLAIREAVEGVTHGHGGPFGCVIVKDGQIAGRGHSLVISNNDPTCHGVIAAIRNAGQTLGTFDLSGCTLYTTGEPCTMCLCACLWANIDRVYYGCTIADSESSGFRDRELDALFGGREALGDYLVCVDRDACLALFDAYQGTKH